MWLGSVLFNKRDGNIFGDDYDAKGYNAKGYDFDGFNKSGVDAEGHHFIEGLTDTELNDSDDDLLDIHDHHH
ncbi:MAG: hypothetical protein IPL27_01160 [Lewinellaceae bacterium]|nr:hypothetical protein [Lewinellaceae bacterium]